MGDVAMTVPVIRALGIQYPELKITVLTKEFFSPLFRDLKNVSVFYADVKLKYKGLKGLYKLSKELKQFKFDAVADLHNVLRSNILKRLLLVKSFAQIDKGRAEKKALVSGESFQQLKTTHKRYADVFEQLGFIIQLSNPIFPKPVLLKENLQNLFKKGNKTIGIAPFAAYKSKMYPLELMQEVINELAKEYQVILFGGGDKEVIQLEKIASKYQNVTNIAGKLTLDEELDVISNLDGMLSMDSGNGHIAAMLGIKVITIWGVTHPFAGFLPFNQAEKFCLMADRTKFPKIPTSVYGNKYPKGYESAIETISPNNIVLKIKSSI
ncbi:MAG: ADP-heptose--LPS heptosyltransferase RfaF [Bacteroidetes bacterium]|nr:MAG: ADP-heptose--LPS heptosyltransferase RfaF [Bacteroidota bacterium]